LRRPWGIAINDEIRDVGARASRLDGGQQPFLARQSIGLTKSILKPVADPSAQMGFLRHHQWNARPGGQGLAVRQPGKCIPLVEVWRSVRDPRSTQSRNCAFGHNARDKKRPGCHRKLVSPGREDVSVATGLLSVQALSDRVPPLPRSN